MVSRSRSIKWFARETKSDIALLIVLYLLLIIVSLAVLYPILYVISSSFSSPNAINSGKVVLLPVEFTIIGYERILQYTPPLDGVYEQRHLCAWAAGCSVQL